MFRKGWRRPDKREDALQFNAAERFYAGAADKEAANQRVILPKRDRIKRADGKPLVATEHEEQKTVIDWWRNARGLYRLPLFALFSVPNGSYLSSGFYAASTLKSEGMRPGAPDLFLAAPTPSFSGLFIEMKRVGGKAPSDEQVEFIDYLLSAGYSASVHYGAASAISAIEEYLKELLP